LRDKQDSNLHKYRLLSRFRPYIGYPTILKLLNLLLTAPVLMTSILMYTWNFRSFSLSSLWPFYPLVVVVRNFRITIYLNCFLQRNNTFLRPNFTGRKSAYWREAISYILLSVC